ncbi:hypothetical protein LTR91_022630 [Friedmanniomyces endolithicus]|uniref:AB hydrolase-1 domain-containing protein n=1 Tax=Friedmanniomyces endolithicus TaxID=329885 RepID=A0AAN6H4V1_9PEZI|nr:hypothetical protein LTS01_023282 [Friedmanniomyces endolithicus]KAK0955909.1 hypothetical protein LTR91_022630 [Friedmanniomyces endolithicus]KAK1023230.1 hypothetical protein LTS16_025067 [Friedmanniomyces endolithicus]
MVVQNIKTAGGTLAVDVLGSGPLVVCAHGMGDCRDVYAPFVESLVAQGYTVANMDTRGHGDSSTTFRQYGDLASVDEFLTIINELGKGPAVLVGNAFTTASATIAASKEPDQVRGLILLAPFLRSPVNVVVAWLMPLLFKQPWGPLVWSMYAPTTWPGLGAQAKERAANTIRLLKRPGRWSAFYKTVCGADHSTVAPYINGVKCPALVVMGDKDPDFSDPAKEAGWVASNFKHATKLLLQGIGHAPQLESPEAVNKAASEFLPKLRQQGAFGSSAL